MILSSNVIRIFFLLQKYKIKILRNWTFRGHNGIIIAGFLLLLFIGLSALNYNYNENRNNEALVFLYFLIIIFVSFLASKAAITRDEKCDPLSLSILTSEELMRLKQLQSVCYNLSVYLFLIIAAAPDFLFYESGLFKIGLGILSILGLLYPLVNGGKKKKIVKKTRDVSLWRMETREAYLPVRGIIARDFLYFKRVNLFFIFKYILLAAFINFYAILFVVNNGLYGYIYVSFFIQFLAAAMMIFDLPKDNNYQLLNDYGKYIFVIVKAEFIYWSALFTFQFIALLPLYVIAVPESSVIIFAAEFIAIELILLYGLLIKNAYDGGSLPIVVSFIFPPLIPWLLYRTIKDNK